MRVRIVFAVLAGWFVISCGGDDPSPQDLVTYTHNVEYGGWLFASGPDGKVLDLKKLEYNQPVSLMATNPPDSFSITLVLVPFSRTEYINVMTYSGIKPGASFQPTIVKGEQREQIQQQGKVTVQVTNYPDEQELPLIVADQYQSTTYESSGTTTPTFLMNVWESKASRFLVNGYNGDMTNPVYKYIDTDGVDAVAYADFGSFTPFEKTIDIKGFDTDLNVKIGFTMSSSVNEYVTGTQFAEFLWDYTGTSPVAKVGYLDDFESYDIQLNIYEINSLRRLRRFHSYTYRGPITKQIEILDDELTIINESIPGMQFSYSGKYDMREHAYSFEDSNTLINWTVYSGPGEPMPVKEIPKEILDVHPDIDPAAMGYLYSDFYKYYDGYNYDQYVQEYLSTSYRRRHAAYEQTFYK